MFRLKFKYIFFAFLLPLFLYLGLYTWNSRTAALDRFAAYTGMEFAGLILAPGKWAAARTRVLWNRYFFLVGTAEENERLREKIDRLKLERIRLREKASELKRVQSLLQFSPPDDWDYEGARVIARRLGPNAALGTIFINKGSRDGVHRDQPVLTPEGVVGRIYKAAPHFASVLLLTDPNSHIPVLGQNSRTNGITEGQGRGESIQVRHVPRNALLFSRELLVTSGLADIYPKGLPVARIKDIELSELSLFKKVVSEPLVNSDRLEEVLVLKRNEHSDPLPLTSDESRILE
ncbi:MAG: rod shape-determining protein MreC [Desulfohalobiaceae bacterium]|nr:rod shape-determining protein MreC [Desulfohalobiaceae bacterium]